MPTPHFPQSPPANIPCSNDATYPLGDNNAIEDITLTKYVRVRSQPDAKFVMFDFAIGDPTLFVELVLPPKAFAEFCQKNAVVPMSEAQMAYNDAEEDKWRYGEESTLVGDNHAQQLLS